MKCIRLLFIIPLGFLFISCTKPIYTSFDTYTATFKESMPLEWKESNKIVKESQKKAGEILKNIMFKYNPTLFESF